MRRSRLGWTPNGWIWLASAGLFCFWFALVSAALSLRWIIALSLLVTGAWTMFSSGYLYRENVIAAGRPPRLPILRLPTDVPDATGRASSSLTVRPSARWKGIVAVAVYSVIAAGVCLVLTVTLAVSSVITVATIALTFFAGYVYRQAVHDEGRRPPYGFLAMPSDGRDGPPSTGTGEPAR